MIHGLVGINQNIKTYAVVKKSEKRTYYGDLVIHLKSEMEKSKFVKEHLTKHPWPNGNFFSLRKIYITEGLAHATDNDDFVKVEEEKMEIGTSAETWIRNLHPGKLVSDGHRLTPDLGILNL